ncbi:MAG: cofactor-independent phosphoglycerate mutase [Verrucomicrobia bacterium]|nr:cofactor-independent phosphoglycerate mutase [Verrucomicrobiota bacterium]
MKHVVLVGDGMGDYPVEELGGKSPLQAASIPHIRRISAAGKVYMVNTVPEGMSPGSDVANLGLLGYNAAKNYTGRAPIEAAGAGIPLSSDEVAYRCNLVTISDGDMDDYSAGHITTKEAHEIITTLQSELGEDGLTFHGGVSYRHLLIWKDGPTDIKTEPPHNISGKTASKYLPAGDRQEEVRKLMDASKVILEEHPVNKARIAEGKKPATQIWLWGQGRALSLEDYRSLYGLGGGVISAVDLVRGLGVLAGLDAPVIDGATGFTDTNYRGKVAAALEVLKTDDFVYVHVEAPDECGHMGDAKMKTEAISAFDANVVAPIWKALEEAGKPYRLYICTDHRTPVSLKGHTSEPVPLAILNGPTGEVTEERPFDEFVDSGVASGMAHDLMRRMLSA